MYSALQRSAFRIFHNPIMTPYKDLSGRSGIEAYEIRDRSIAIRFKYGGVYVYDYNIPGRDAVEEMKRLAQQGRDLSAYISRNVRRQYARKL
jgi:hypothetical protein